MKITKLLVLSMCVVGLSACEKADADTANPVEATEEAPAEEAAEEEAAEEPAEEEAAEEAPAEEATDEAAEAAPEA